MKFASMWHQTAIALVTAGVVFFARDAEAAPNARSIMEKVAENRKLDGSEAVVKMTIINEKGQTRERKLKMATRLFDGGSVEKRVYKFLDPADVKGTGVLVFDYAAKADDVWLFLPALRKTRRIVASQGSKSFLGSEFSYADLNIPAIDDYTYTFVAEESAGGESCWKIDVLPKNDQVAKSEGYQKKTYWVSKKSHAVRKGLFYAPDGSLLKELKTQDIKLLDSKKGRWRTMRMEMINKKNQRRSVFQTEKVAFNPGVKQEYFTQTYIERP